MNTPRLLSRLPLFALVALSALSAACSSGPGESDIHAALVHASSPGGLKLVEIGEVEKIGCEKSGDAYLCDVSYGVRFGKTEQKTTARLRFVKTGEGWRTSGAG